jgi:hypothetical protein
VADRKFQLKFVGDRFDGGRLPVSALSDLSAFRDLLASFAKDQWRENHRSKKRLPNGFVKSLDLFLTEIEDGSAVPVLEWSDTDADKFLPGFSSELEDTLDASYNKIVQLVEEASTGRYPTALSSEHVRALNKFGSGLQEKERIEFVGSKDANGNVVYLDDAKRKAIITNVSETYEKRIHALGRLSGVHENGTLTLTESLFPTLLIPVDPSRIADDFDGNIGSTIQFEILVELDHEDRIKEVRETTHAEIIEPNLVEHVNAALRRLTEIQGLDAGWLDGKGIQPATNAIRIARELIQRRPSVAEKLALFPIPEGGVELAIRNKKWDFSVEVMANGTLELDGLSLRDGTSRDLIEFSSLDASFFEAFDELSEE